MDEQTSIQVCGLIAGVLASDQDMNNHEAEFLQRIRRRFGVPKRVAAPPVVDPDEAVEQLLAFPEEVRTEALELLIQAAAADGKIAEQERALLSGIVAKLGIDPAELQRRLERAAARHIPQPFAADR